MMRIAILLLLVLAASPADARPSASQTDEPDAVESAAEGTSSPEKALESLRSLTKRRADLERRLSALAQDDEEREELERNLAEIEEQFAMSATGVSDEEFAGQGSAPFDLNAEIQSLVEPFVSLMKDATKGTREIEELRREVARQERLAQTAEHALTSLEPLRAAAAGPGDAALAGSLDAMEEKWRGRRDAATDLAAALQHQLDQRLEERRNPTEAPVDSAAAAFFRDRTLSLAFGFGALLVVFTVMRLVHVLVKRARSRVSKHRTFRMRLFDLVFSALTFLASIGAMLVVFNLRHDWMLLGASGFVIAALLWMGLQMLPGAVEPVTLLLNLGAVQEGERVLFEGVPYRVKNLDFYTELENPKLEGSNVALPVRTLVGLHSRPTGPDEPWFPTRKGDFVWLGDGTRGKVVSQSPELVEIRVPGNSWVTYTTADFLAAQPKNLSHGYRAEIEFGIGYVHQDVATNEVMTKLQEHVREGLEKLVEPELVLDVSVELTEAGDSAIVYEVEADMHGDAADRIEAVERELARLCVDACNVHGWEIPFPQMVLHGKLAS